jgi:hypothetical protein
MPPVIIENHGRISPNELRILGSLTHLHMAVLDLQQIIAEAETLKNDSKIQKKLNSVVNNVIRSQKEVQAVFESDIKSVTEVKPRAHDDA